MTAVPSEYNEIGVLSPNRAPWILLFGRVMAFAAIQAVFAFGFSLSGSLDAWLDSAAWWPYVVGLTNLVFLVLLTGLYRAEGKNYWRAITPVNRKTVIPDLLVLLVSMLPVALTGYYPNILLATWLFGSPEVTLRYFIQPLPVFAVYFLMFFFPVTQGLTELPAYYIYVMPRLKSQGLPGWAACALSSLMLGLQHAAAPLILNLSFFTWRALMFVPFAFCTGAILYRRPRLLPYMLLIHILMNMSFSTMFLASAY